MLHTKDSMIETRRKDSFYVLIVKSLLHVKKQRFIRTYDSYVENVPIVSTRDEIQQNQNLQNYRSEFHSLCSQYKTTPEK